MTSVSILGMGATLSSYLQDFESNGYQKPTDQVWAINSAGVWLRNCDMLIALDNFRRDTFMDGGKHRQYVKNILTSGIPIMTDVVDAELFEELEIPPAAVEAYPLREVISSIWPEATSSSHCFPWFQNSVNYALALAITRGFKEIRLYGCNFVANDNPFTIAAVAQEHVERPYWWVYHMAPINKGRRLGEPGLETTAFLIGICHERRIDLWIANGDSLMNRDRAMYWYGYEDQPDPFEENELEIPMRSLPRD